MAVHVDGHGWVTSLTAPHRIHDAILRDSELEEERDGKKQRVRFRDSQIGQEIVGARLHDAVGLYKHCPTALIFGTWDSTAGEGLDSTKVPRAVVSEIIGIDITPGVRTASKLDPLGIRAQSATVYRLKDREDDWTLDESEAATTDKGDKKKFGKGKPSDINHGNVTPDVPRFDQQEIRRQNLGRLPDIIEASAVELRYDLNSGDGRIESRGFFRSDDVRIRPGAVKPGGITMAYALHTWTLSLTQLRRLRFSTPVKLEAQATPAGKADDGTAEKPTADHRDEAARTVLAAIGKTSVLDLAVFELALQATRKPSERTAARRVCFVIDRRLVVDEVTEHARRIGHAIQAAANDQNAAPVLRAVAQRLRTLAPDGGAPLRLVRLRGGIYRDDGWAADPLTPTIIVSTVDQLGSRLLFCGYGVTQRNLAVHAGLLAFDTRIILDEAHLSRVFADTMDLARRYQKLAETMPLPESRLLSMVRMSATVSESGRSFELIGKERTDKPLKPRLESIKQAELVESRSTPSRRRCESSSPRRLANRSGTTASLSSRRLCGRRGAT